MSALEVSMMKRVGELNAEIKLRTAELTNCKAEADRLKAENAFLKAENESLMTSPASRLLRASRAENERLRKAGDGLIDVLNEMDVIMDMDSDHTEVQAWNAAKEGNPSV